MQQKPVIGPKSGIVIYMWYRGDFQALEIVVRGSETQLNHFKPEFTIVVFIHYKPQIAVAIPDLEWIKMTWSGWEIKENCHVLVNQFYGHFRSQIPSCRKIKCIFYGCTIMML